MEIRAAEVDDAEAIERIRIAGWQTAYRGIYPTAFLDALKLDWSRWRERIATPPPGWSSFVAEHQGVVTGFAVIGPSREEEATGELYALYVDPSLWSTGIGRALLQRAEELLAGRYSDATLWVMEENPRARQFYERAGWCSEDARKPFEHGGVAPLAIRYRKRPSSSASRS
jgi:GNAT superfamily N-acetyltransferase